VLKIGFALISRWQATRFKCTKTGGHLFRRAGFGYGI
jgi:hypothetical protein